MELMWLFEGEEGRVELMWSFEGEEGKGWS